MARKPKVKKVGEWWEGLTGGGKLLDEKCPMRECDGDILSNGNLFCENWGKEWGGTCDWALPHPQTLYRDQMIAWRTGGYWEKLRFRGDIGEIIRTEPVKPDWLVIVGKDDK